MPYKNEKTSILDIVPLTPNKSVAPHTHVNLDVKLLPALAGEWTPQRQCSFIVSSGTNIPVSATHLHSPPQPPPTDLNPQATSRSCNRHGAGQRCTTRYQTAFLDGHPAAPTHSTSRRPRLGPWEPSLVMTLVPWYPALVPRLGAGLPKPTLDFDILGRILPFGHPGGLDCGGPWGLF